MSKKDFIKLADAIRYHNANVFSANGTSNQFNRVHLIALAEWCREQNPRFMRERWLAYIAGECGPNGGSIKRERAA